MMRQRTILLPVRGLIFVCMLTAYGACMAATGPPKAAFVMEVPSAQLDDLRRFVHDLTVRWNMRNEDDSHKFPTGSYILNTFIQRPDGLKARFLGGPQRADESSTNIRLIVTCDPPCEDWQPFVKALEAEVSKHWKTSAYEDPRGATRNNRSRGP